MVRSSSSPSLAYIAGGSGLVGRNLLDLLLADDRVSRVVSFVRRPSGRSNSKLEERVVDFAGLPRGADVETGARVFCTLGTTIRKAGSQEAFRNVDFTCVVGLAEAAKAGGAAVFSLVSSLGADPASRVFYSRVKGETEAAVRALGIPSVQVFRPSLLLGDRGETRPGEKVGEAIAKLIPFSLLGPLRVYEPVEAAAVARAMVARAWDAAPGFEVIDSAAIRKIAG